MLQSPSNNNRSGKETFLFDIKKLRHSPPLPSTFATTSDNSEKGWTEKEGRQDSAPVIAVMIRRSCLDAAGRILQPYFTFQASYIDVFTRG